MAGTKSVDESSRRRAPARTPQARENQMIDYAVDLAERQLRAGTASAQVITHFLKLGTERERLEREKISMETEMIRAKADALAAGGHLEEIYTQALSAMKSYAGQEEEMYEEPY